MYTYFVQTIVFVQTTLFQPNVAPVSSLYPLPIPEVRVKVSNLISNYIKHNVFECQHQFSSKL